MSNLINLPTYEQQESILNKINQGYFETLRKETETLLSKTISLPSTGYVNYTYVEGLSIQGEGVLSEILVNAGSKGGQETITYTLRVTADGVEGTIQVSANYEKTSNRRLVNPMFCKRMFSPTSLVSELTGISYTIDSTSNLLGTFQMPIRFKNSLKVEHMVSANAGTNSFSTLYYSLK